MTGADTHRMGTLAVMATIVLSAAAQLLMKAGMIELHHAAPVADALVSWSGLVWPVLWAMAGLACYGASMLLWLIALARFQLSYAYPMLSASYVLVYGISAWMPYYAEAISVQRLIGIGLIIAGVAMVTRSTGSTNDGRA